MSFLLDQWQELKGSLTGMNTRQFLQQFVNLGACLLQYGPCVSVMT
jgi:hypothetical protein